MRFSHCLIVSAVVHALILAVLPGHFVPWISGGAASDTISVRVLDEPPIIKPPPPSLEPTEPVFKPSADAEGARAGMGALLAEPRPRSPSETPTPVRPVEPATRPDPGVGAPTEEPYPSASDPEDAPYIEPTIVGWDERASEAPSKRGGDVETRFVSEAPPKPETAAPASSPVGDVDVGAGHGGTDPEGLGPPAPAAGPGPAPPGPGEGYSGAGTGERGPGGADRGGGAGAGGSGEGQGGPAVAPSAQPKQGRLVAVATPPFPTTSEMRKLNIHGTVGVNITVNASGTIVSATVVSGSGYPQYDSQAASWVRNNWRYQWVDGPGRTVTQKVQVRF